MNPKTILSAIVMCFSLLCVCAASEYRNQPLTKELVASGITIVDIRTEPEWRETGVVPGSVLKTFYRKDHSYDLEGFIAELDLHLASDEEIALLCRSGNRSARLAALLSERGYRTIINITGGIRSAAGNGVELEPYPVTP